MRAASVFTPKTTLGASSVLPNKKITDSSHGKLHMMPVADARVGKGTVTCLP